LLTLTLPIIIDTQNNSYTHATNKHVHLDVNSITVHCVHSQLRTCYLSCIHITLAEHVNCQIYTKILLFCIPHNLPTEHVPIYLKLLQVAVNN